MSGRTLDLPSAGLVTRPTWPDGLCLVKSRSRDPWQRSFLRASSHRHWIADAKNGWRASRRLSTSSMTESMGLAWAGLADNESFITALLHASQAAVRTHEQEKRSALRNAVVNAALPSAPDDELQIIFLNYVDELTPTHLRILRVLDDPETFLRTNGISYSPGIASSVRAMLIAALPDLEPRSDALQAFGRDLFGRHLTNTDSFGTMMTSSGAFARRTTDWGRQFLHFISDPEAGASRLDSH